MTDKPIIFSAPMIRALLDGRKSQTRRVLKPQPFSNVHPTDANTIGDADEWERVRIPYAPGDRLWVREAFSITNDGCAPSWLSFRADPIGTRATPCSPGMAYGSRTEWKSPIHMPRWASRLTLTVTDVRVQRVQDISAEDVTAEGIPFEPDAIAPYEWSVSRFADLWNSIHGPGAWDANPWVAAISFTGERRNIDAVAT